MIPVYEVQRRYSRAEKVRVWSSVLYSILIIWCNLRVQWFMNDKVDFTPLKSFSSGTEYWCFFSMWQRLGSYYSWSSISGPGIGCHVPKTMPITSPPAIALHPTAGAKPPMFSHPLLPALPSTLDHPSTTSSSNSAFFTALSTNPVVSSSFLTASSPLSSSSLPFPRHAQLMPSMSVIFS